jgi:chromosomal replication initiation ATPase DnaA
MNKSYSDATIRHNLFELLMQYKRDPVSFSKVIRSIAKNDKVSENTQMLNMLKEISYVIQKHHSRDDIILNYTTYIIAKVFNVSEDDLRNLHTREDEIPLAKQMLCYFLAKNQFKNKAISKFMRYSNHTSVFYSLKRIQNLIDTKDPLTLEYIEKINKELTLNTYINA